ncbi:hypothetical protein D3C72_1354820 [compost metagenome]
MAGALGLTRSVKTSRNTQNEIFGAIHEDSGYRRKRLHRRALCAFCPGAGPGRAGQRSPGRECGASGTPRGRIHPGRLERPGTGARTVFGRRGRGALRRCRRFMGALSGFPSGQRPGHRERGRSLPQATGTPTGAFVVAVDLFRWSRPPGPDRRAGAQALQTPLCRHQVPGRAKSLRRPGVRSRNPGPAPAFRDRGRRHEHLPAPVEHAAQGAPGDHRQRSEQS